MNGRVNINVSATEYEKTSREMTKVLNLVEEMVHETDGFVVTDSEFAFGWHFFRSICPLRHCGKAGRADGSGLSKAEGKDCREEIPLMATGEDGKPRTQSKACHKRRDGVQQVRDFLGPQQHFEAFRLFCLIKCTLIVCQRVDSRDQIIHRNCSGGKRIDGGPEGAAP